MSIRFGTDGIRGVANSELYPELVLALGRAAARHLGAGTFLVGRDTRRSGPMLSAALSAGLASEGTEVLDVGVIPTPGLAWLAAQRGLPAAMISASHNPFSDNGIKLLSPEGTKLSAETERAVENEFDALLASSTGSGPSAATGAAVGAIIEDPTACAAYEDYLVAAVPGARAPALRVVCDCANGAASTLAPAVLSRLSIEARVISASPDGTNINATCGATSPESLAAAVVAGGADLGLCFDGDADRLLAVDHEGTVIDGDHLIALFAFDLDDRHLLERRTVVVTVMSNLGLRRALDARGIAVIETSVGDRHVTDALEANGLVLGGEQSGHIVFRREATTGDGILTALKLIELVSRKQRPLAELAREAMTRLPQELRNVPVVGPSRLGGATAVWEEVTAVEASLGGWGRVLVRPSGTEATVRVMVEAEQRETAIAAAERLASVVVRELGGDPPR